MRARTAVARTAAMILVVAGGTLTGAVASSVLARPDNEVSTEAQWNRLAREHSDSAYDAALVRFDGRLSATVAPRVAALGAEDLVLVVLRRPDLITCEDLGRQLRELQRATGSGRSFAIMIDAAGAEPLRRFLRSERIRDVPVLVGDPKDYVADRLSPATPAALLVDGTGRITRGISHPLRFANTRSRSFAQELGLSGP